MDHLCFITIQMIFSRSKQSWDDFYLQQLTYIPQHLWWFVWLVINLYVVFHAFHNYIL
ncbi:hypothetical protein D0Z25_07670 [Staphylococcus epidermidis]|nr:hypothetical protein [Staphylococcus epidermidis]